MEPANKQNYTIKLEENKGKICFKVCLFVRAVAHGYQCLFQSEIHSLKSCNRLLATQFNVLTWSKNTDTTALVFSKQTCF